MSILDFFYNYYYLNENNSINGIRILKFRTDIVLKNFFFDKNHSSERLTKNPYEVLPIVDASQKRIEEIPEYPQRSYYDIDAKRIWDNDTSILTEMGKVLYYGDLVKADVLFHNQILFVERNDVVVYYDEQKDQVKRISRKQIKKLIGHDEKYHTVVILPYHLSYRSDYQLEKDLYPSYGENLEKFKKVFENHEMCPITKKLGRIKFKSKSRFCPCEKDEIVYIFGEGKLRDRFKVINQKGEMKQATRHQLCTLPEKLQDVEKKRHFLDARNKFLINDQENGISCLVQINHVNEASVYGKLSNGQHFNIPKSLIPLYKYSSYDMNDEDIKNEESLEDLNIFQWIKIPIWYYKRCISF